MHNSRTLAQSTAINLKSCNKIDSMIKYISSAELMESKIIKLNRQEEMLCAYSTA